MTRLVRPALAMKNIRYEGHRYEERAILRVAYEPGGRVRAFRFLRPAVNTDRATLTREDSAELIHFAIQHGLVP